MKLGRVLEHTRFNQSRVWSATSGESGSTTAYWTQYSILLLCTQGGRREVGIHHGGSQSS